MAVVVSNLNYSPSTCLVKPVGVAHIQVKPLFKKGKRGYSWSQIIVQYQQGGIASNLLSAFSCTSHEKLVKPSHFQSHLSVTCLGLIVVYKFSYP
jgi:hypothetical protein